MVKSGLEKTPMALTIPAKSLTVRKTEMGSVRLLFDCGLSPCLLSTTVSHSAKLSKDWLLCLCRLEVSGVFCVGFWSDSS